MTSREEAVEAILARARMARADLVEVAEQLRARPGAEVPDRVSELVARVIGALYAAEIAEPRVLTAALERALDGLAALREELPLSALPEMDAAVLDRLSSGLELRKQELEQALAEAF